MNQRKSKPPMSQDEAQTISAKWSVSIPVVIIVISAVATNLGMYYSMDRKTAVLDTKFSTVQNIVTETRAAVERLSVKVSAEVRSIRREQEAAREKLSDRITTLQIELAKVTAERDSKNGPPK